MIMMESRTMEEKTSAKRIGEELDGGYHDDKCEFQVKRNNNNCNVTKDTEVIAKELVAVVAM